MAEPEGRKRPVSPETTDTSKRGREDPVNVGYSEVSYGKSGSWWVTMMDSSYALPPLASIAPCEALELLDISDCGWTVRDVEVLSELLAHQPTIHTLTYCMGAASTNNTDGARAFARMCKTYTSIRRLKIGFQGPIFSGAFLDELAEPYGCALTLEELTVSTDMRSDSYPLARLITHNKSLKKLCLEVSVDLHALKPALSANTSLRVLSLTDLEFGDEGAVALAEILEVNTALEELRLKRNSMTADGARAIASALQRYNTTLRTLKVKCNTIRDDGAVAMAEMLMSNTTLTHLSLTHCRIQCEGVSRLAEALRSNTTLTRLSLFGNTYSTTGRLALADLIRTNTPLEALILSSPGDETPILEALKENTTLTHIRLNHTGDVAAITNMLLGNMTLMKFTVDPDQLRLHTGSQEDEQTLIKALESNTTIQHLQMSILFDGPTHDRIWSILRRNKEIARQSHADTKPASHA